MGFKPLLLLFWISSALAVDCDLTVFRELLTPKERFDAVQVPQSNEQNKTHYSSMNSYHSEGDQVQFIDVQAAGDRVFSEVEYFPNPKKHPKLKLKGYFEINANPQSVVFNDAFLDHTVRSEEQTFRIPRKGTHPKDYRLAIFQMVKLMKWKLGKNCFGKIPLFGQRNVVHFDSVVDLTLAKKAWEKQNGRPMPDSEIAKHYRTTPIFKYIEAIINETGHEITDVELYFRPGMKLNGLFGQSQAKKMPDLEEKLRDWNRKYRTSGIQLTFEDEAVAHFDVAIHTRPTSLQDSRR